MTGATGTTMKLWREGPGAYVTDDGRFRVERDDYDTECSHPLCDTLHQRLRLGEDHLVRLVSWHVWDVERDDYAIDNTFDTKREAVRALEGLYA